MPLTPGKSNDVLSRNIREVMHSWQKKGSIGKSKVKSKKKAQKMAIAIAYSKRRGG